MVTDEVLCFIFAVFKSLIVPCYSNVSSHLTPMCNLKYGSEQLETIDAGEEEMEINNRASQNSQRVVELKKKKYAI